MDHASNDVSPGTDTEPTSAPRIDHHAAPEKPDIGTGYEFHPIAEIFPLMIGPEFDDLVDDINAQGLFEPIMLHEDQILDGRNRYRGCQKAGVEPRYDTYDGDDPTGYVLSKNLHRRHLTRKEIDKLITDLLKANPKRTDRSIARDVGRDHKTVASRRKEAEGRGEIPHVEQRTDTKGRQQRATKAKAANSTRKQRSTASAQRSSSASDTITASDMTQPSTSENQSGVDNQPVVNDRDDLIAEICALKLAVADRDQLITQLRMQLAAQRNRIAELEKENAELPEQRTVQSEKKRDRGRRVNNGANTKLLREKMIDGGPCHVTELIKQTKHYYIHAAGRVSKNNKNAHPDPCPNCPDYSES